MSNRKEGTQRFVDENVAADHTGLIMCVVIEKMVNVLKLETGLQSIEISMDVESIEERINEIIDTEELDVDIFEKRDENGNKKLVVKTK